MAARLESQLLASQDGQYKGNAGGISEHLLLRELIALI